MTENTDWNLDPGAGWEVTLTIHPDRYAYADRDIVDALVGPRAATGLTGVDGYVLDLTETWHDLLDGVRGKSQARELAFTVSYSARRILTEAAHRGELTQEHVVEVRAVIARICGECLGVPGDRVERMADSMIVHYIGKNATID